MKDIRLHTTQCPCLTILQAGPIALGNIGYKYVYVFVAWDTIEAGAWYLLGVEAKGRTLEELEWVYDQKNPVKASKLKSNPIRDPEQ